ncbi:MAG: Maf family protein [Oscillospiraceae bacterium]|jgi:septum formation protein|nr:Maf family protein [Oscillospiraceae bacterium]
MKYILASASPRRKELLAMAGLEFDVYAPQTDESFAEGTPPEDAVQLIAAKKAARVALLFPEDCVIAADTIVTIDGAILGKPKDHADAARMLRLLSSRTHQVVTGVCLRLGGLKRVFAQTTDVTFYPLSEDEIEAYIQTGECADKAGAYAIQGRGGLFAARLTGDYYNVVGLPIARLTREIAAFFSTEHNEGT